MKKEVHLCEDQPREWQTQSRYTPDPGTVEGPVYCGVCGTQCDENRGINGPRGFAMAISGSKSLHDVFTCPHREDSWHRQVVAIRNEARATASTKLKTMLLDEADEILEARAATMVVSPLRGN